MAANPVKRTPRSRLLLAESFLGLDGGISRLESLHGTESFAEQYPDIIVGAAVGKAAVIALNVGKSVVFRPVVTLVVDIGAGLGVGISTSSVQNRFSCLNGMRTVLLLLFGILRCAAK